MNIKHWIVGAVSIMVASYLIPGVEVNLLGAFILALVLGLINIFIKPFIFVLTLPINIVTLGLFSLVINAGLILFADWLVPDFYVSSFWSALLFSIVLSLITMLFGRGTKAQ